MTQTQARFGPDRSVTMRSIEEDDIEEIRVWRNDQIAVLRQSRLLSPKDQALWWGMTYQPQSRPPHPRQLLFVMLAQGRRVAYGGLTNIEWEVRRAEISFLAATAIAADPAEYEQTQRRFLAFLIDLGFGQLGLRRLFSETYEFRTRHIRTLEAAGLKPEGRLRSHAWAEGRVVDSLIHGALASETPLPKQWVTP